MRWCQECGHEPSWHRLSKAEINPCIYKGCTCHNYKMKEKKMSERDDLVEQAYSLPPLTTPAPREETAQEIQGLIADGARGLDFLLKRQQEIEIVWGRQVDPDDPEAISKYIREVVLCATDELHEVLSEVHWKPWKDRRGIRDVAKYREEMADVLHFILDLYLAAGLSGRDIILDYMTKNCENLERRKSADYRAS